VQWKHQYVQDIFTIRPIAIKYRNGTAASALFRGGFHPSIAATATGATRNTDDHDDEGQTRSGGFDLNYFAHSKKCDEAQNKPIEGWRRGLSRNSSPCSRHSKCSANFFRLRLFQKLWQPRNIYCDSAGFVTRQTAWRPISAPDIRERLRRTQQGMKTERARKL
jgi:hypothetical protein